MINIDIPGFGALQLSNLVLDYNGTLAVDGKLLRGVGSALTVLSSKLEVHVITADTFGIAASQLAALPVKLTIVPNEAQAEAKLQFVTQLGADNVVAIGNGRNDRMMLEAAAVGIAVIQAEGASAATLSSADVATPTILDAFALLLNPKRLIATLRS
jgi:P-type E1-E2 ATPase